MKKLFISISLLIHLLGSISMAADSNEGVYLYDSSNKFIYTNYDIADIVKYYKNKIVSFKIVGSKYVILFEKKDFKGKSFKCEGEKTQQLSDNILKKVGSVRVISNTNTRIYLFSDIANGGDRCEVFLDSVRAPFCGSIGKNKVSSIYIDGNYEVRLYEHNDFKGNTRVIKGPGSYDLRDINFNDKVNSITITSLEPYKLKFLVAGDPQYYGNWKINDDAKRDKRNTDKTLKYLGEYARNHANGVQGGLIIPGDLCDKGYKGVVGLDSRKDYKDMINKVLDFGVPVFDTYGNHDYYGKCPECKPDLGLLTPIRMRSSHVYNNGIVEVYYGENAKNIVSADYPHYYWKINGIYFISVGLYPGDDPASSGPQHWINADPYLSYNYLKNTLDSIKTADPNAPIFIVQHYNFDASGGWWTSTQQDKVKQLVSGYNVLAFLVGHKHGQLRSNIGINNSKGHKIQEIVSGRARGCHASIVSVDNDTIIDVIDLDAGCP